MSIDASPAARAPEVLKTLWLDAGLPAAALSQIELIDRGPVLPSSFKVAVAAQASLGAAALAAAEIGQRRGGSRQGVVVDGEHATLESLGWFSIDGRTPQIWDKLSGLYPCGGDVGAAGHLRIHANFAHHRDGALRLLGCPPGDATTRDEVTQALRRWRAEDFENAAAEAGLAVAALRRFEDWDRHAQAQALATQPLVAIERIGEAPPLAWPARDGDGDGDSAPLLQGLRVLDLTRILAGPVAGRTLATYGADVMLVNSPNLPNIEAIADTSRGKRSAHVDLSTEPGRETLRTLVREAHVFMQGYRPGAIAAHGFGARELAALRPGIVVVCLSAYGPLGPWAGRRGFDSLVQTATGFNAAEAEAFGSAEPKPMPLQILDYAAGYLLAFGAQAALWRQAGEGGSWLVQVSLARVGRWLREQGRVRGGTAVERPPLEPYLVELDSGYGRLRVPRHAAQFARTPACRMRPSMPPGSHAPRWREDQAM